MGDFNLDLLKYKNGINTANFLDQACSISFVQQITSPTRLSPRSNTLIDNIFLLAIQRHYLWKHTYNNL